MRKMYARGRISFKCEYCGTPHTEYTSKFSIRKRYNCPAKVCVKKVKGHPGESNPMYGKTHSDAVREASRERAARQFTGKSYEDLYGEDKANALKKIRSQTFSSFYALNPDYVGSWKGRSHSLSSLAKIRAKMIEGGHWRSQDQLSDWDSYNKEANWKSSMWQLLDEESVTLLHQVGVFSRSNTSGAVRDHRFSRWDGFNLLVFPQILRHPSNCKALTNADNARKRSKSSITLENLFSLIRVSDIVWEEHPLVLSLIEQYENGSRWSRRLEV